MKVVFSCMIPIVTLCPDLVALFEACFEARFPPGGLYWLRALVNVTLKDNW